MVTAAIMCLTMDNSYCDCPSFEDNMVRYSFVTSNGINKECSADAHLSTSVIFLFSFPTTGPFLP